MATHEDLYKAIGARIRRTRERGGKKMSQAALAAQLGISRASVVNIEAGRQHAPLGLLWDMAAILNTELAQLIPHRSELLPTPEGAILSATMRKQIKEKAGGDSAEERDLTSFVAQLLKAAESSKPSSRD